LQTKAATRTIKSKTTTFRFDSETLKSLREEAKQKDISTNTLLNQIVKEHLKWHANASNASFIAVRRLLVTNLISHLSEQEIISVAENVAKNTNKDTILLLENEYPMKSALDFIESWIKISGYKYKHHHEINDGQNRHMYIIQHDMGIK
jgi:predicted DNA-binding ribbon-helix-helix protein